MKYSTAIPRLPHKRIEVALLSGEYPEIAQKLNSLGIQTVTTTADSRLPKAVSFHADMQVCLFDGGRLFALQDCELVSRLREMGISVAETKEPPGDSYPRDVLCNAFLWKNFLVGNPKTMDSSILQAARERGLEVLQVAQGYAACAVCSVNANSIITGDEGMAKAFREKNAVVLLIRPGHIALPGYEYGFLGGCVGLLDSDTIAFTGRLDSHPDGPSIRRFLHERNLSVIELTDNELLDIGGILPLR